MKTFRSRLVLSFSLLVAAVIAGAGAWVYLLVAESLRVDIDRLVQDRAFILSRSVAPSGMTLQPWMEALLETDRRGLRAQVLDGEGRVTSRSANLAETLPLSAAARGAVATTNTAFTETITDASGDALRLATVPITAYRDGRNLPMGYAQTALPLRQTDARLRKLAVGLAAVTLGATAAAWLLGRLLAGRWLRTLDAARESAQRISAGSGLRERLFVSPGDEELARLAGTFNELLDRLEAAQQNQQRFLADASHELRTPLTILRGEIDVALRRERSTSEYREVLESSREEIERLSRLTGNLLSLARVDAGEGLAVREAVRLADVCSKVARDFTPQAEAAGAIIHLELDESATVHGDGVALERVVANLLENALRYAPRDEAIFLRGRRDGSYVVLEVADTGPGISAEHLPHLFERFYRVDKARSRNLGGSGLGLAIVKALVEAHGGSVSVVSEVGRGTTFTMRLPLAA